MFGCSFLEFLVIALVALLALGPKEALSILSFLRSASNKLEELYKLYITDFERSMQSAISEQECEEEIVKHIIDLDGNIQRTYDLSKIVPIIKDDDKTIH